MKKSFKYISSLVLACIAIGCSDLDEINKNPNDITAAHPQLLLPQIGSTAFRVEGTGPLFASRMLILTSEENNYQFYKWGAASFSTYSDLIQVTKMIEEAEKIGNPNYIAIGKFFRAYYFYTMALQFGDIPYSDALKGESDGIYFAKYDTQEQVLEGVLKELEQAVNLIEPQVAVSGDLIYQGNMNQWIKAINSYRLKVLMSLSKKTQVGSINVASEFSKIAAQGPLMSAVSDNLQLVFQDQEKSRYTQFNSSSYGSSMYLSDTYIKLFQERRDPRLFLVAQQTVKALEADKPIDDFTSYKGGDPISPYADNEALVLAKNISKVNKRYYQDPTNEPHAILSFSELQFILAEAAARGWIAGDVAAHYQQGIQASFAFYNAYSKEYSSYFTAERFDDYVEQSSVKFKAGDLQSELKQILTQKYLTQFHQSGWTIYCDHLRTGFPEFAQQKGITPPSRWRYPETEYNQNANNLKEALTRQFSGSETIRSATWWLK